MTNQTANRVLSFATKSLRATAPTRPLDEMRNILVVRLGNLGDTVVALPAFHAIRRRFPQARIVLLTSPTQRGAPGAREVLADDPTFDDTIVYYADESGRPGFWRVLRARLHREAFDLAIMLPDDRSRFRHLAKHLLLLAAAGQRRVMGCELVTPPQYHAGQVARLMALITPITAAPIEPFPWIRVSDTHRREACQRWLKDQTQPIVAMQCGAKRPANRWFPERFAEVGRALAMEYGAHILLTGGAQERALAERVARDIGTGCTSIAGETHITELAAVLERCALLITNDTGTMHVAAAMGTPVVAIFSARDHPFRWYPYGDRHTVIRHDAACGPCWKDVCPLHANPVCLDAITAGQVLGAARAMLREP